MIERTNASISSCPPVCMMCTGPSACPAMVALLGFTSYRSHPTSNGNPISLSLSVSLSLSHNQHKEKSKGAILPLPPPPARPAHPALQQTTAATTKTNKQSVRRSQEGKTRLRNELHAVLFLPGDSRWHRFQPITGKEARGKQTKNKKIFTAPPKNTETNEPNFALRAVGRLSSSNKKKKVVTKDRPEKKKKRTLQHTRARTTNKQTKNSRRRRRRSSKGRESKSNETTRDAHASARSRTHARTRAREARREAEREEKRRCIVLALRGSGIFCNGRICRFPRRERESALFHPELSVNFKSILGGGGDTNLSVVKRIYFQK